MEVEGVTENGEGQLPPPISADGKTSKNDAVENEKTAGPKARKRVTVKKKQLEKKVAAALQAQQEKEVESKSEESEEKGTKSKNEDKETTIATEKTLAEIQAKKMKTDEKSLYGQLLTKENLQDVIRYKLSVQKGNDVYSDISTAKDENKFSGKKVGGQKQSSPSIKGFKIVPKPPPPRDSTNTVATTGNAKKPRTKPQPPKLLPKKDGAASNAKKPKTKPAPPRLSTKPTQPAPPRLSTKKPQTNKPARKGSTKTADTNRKRVPKRKTPTTKNSKTKKNRSKLLEDAFDFFDGLVPALPVLRIPERHEMD